MDFFTVPTVRFRALYVWFAIGHARRRILHFDVTDHPAAGWVIKKLREAFPFDTAPRHLIFDRDSIFSAEVVSTVKSFGIQPTMTAFRSPWQNGVTERWVGSVRRELLDHVVVGNERHLRRLLRDYVAYYHDDRTHLGLGKATPTGRPVERGSTGKPASCRGRGSAACITGTSGARRRSARPAPCDPPHALTPSHAGPRRRASSVAAATTRSRATA